MMINAKRKKKKTNQSTNQQTSTQGFACTWVMSAWMKKAFASVNLHSAPK